MLYFVGLEVLCVETILGPIDIRRIPGLDIYNQIPVLFYFANLFLKMALKLELPMRMMKTMGAPKAKLLARHYCVVAYKR